MNNTKFKLIHFFFYNFTLAKFLGGFITILFVASLKYYLSGTFYIEYNEFFYNVGIGLSGWTLNTGLISLFTEYLGIKGLNFNLYQFIYGFDTVEGGDGSLLKDFKPKLFNAMDIDGESDSNKSSDKGKGIDKKVHPNYDKNTVSDGGGGIGESKPLDKSKIREMLAECPKPVEPHMVTWSKAFPNTDPSFLFKPKGINPGPGFNVPGGEVPIRDDICQHIDHNSHILNQFKRMDLETALEQKKNNLLFVDVLNIKLNHARNALSQIPTVPATERDFFLKKKILWDLDQLNQDRVRAEARATLLNSRIEFIEGQINKK